VALARTVITLLLTIAFPEVHIAYMSFPYDKWSRSRGQKAVPLEVAQKLAEERDRLRAELQKARRDLDELAGDRSARAKQVDSLRERLREAEAEAASLREQLAEAVESEPVEHEQGTEDRFDESEESEIVRRLSHRIEELTKDLERVENRTKRAVEDARKQERVRLLSGLGDVLDSTLRALDMQGPDGPWREGLEAIHNQIVRYLEAEGVRLVGEKGQPMDPNLHEAVGVISAPEYEKGQIVDVERPGLVLEDGTVVRTARVQVAS
jgi:molecular chaperone GrpE